MRILLTGATGYIGKRLLNVLASQDHHIICCVRDKKRFSPPPSIQSKISILEIDFLNPANKQLEISNIDVAYYLMHSMSTSRNYEDLELKVAQNFRLLADKLKIKQVIYLSGIVNDKSLSKHLKSRRNVALELKKGRFHLTSLNAGIIIGSGSASFEIIRDLVEKLPIMITPKWLNTKCQPIGIGDVINILSKSLNNSQLYNQDYDIGGPDVLTYKEILLNYAKERKLKRKIFTLPVMTPRLSSYWLYFVTSTSYKLAVALVNSMKVEVICADSRINKILNIEPISYREALNKTFQTIESNQIISSWKDAFSSGRLKFNISDFINVPIYGCYKDQRMMSVLDIESCLDKVWQIGGTNGWYYANWLWEIRGLLDKIVGGIGLRRGRTDPSRLSTGDALDFWRVLYANKKEGRLLLYAEMKLPGEAWLEFKIEDQQLIQTATFRPKGLWGRFYWFLVYPLHSIIFNGLLKKLTQ